MLTELKNSITLPSMGYRMLLVGTADSCKARGRILSVYNGFVMLVLRAKSIQNFFSTSKPCSHTVVILYALTKLT